MINDKEQIITSKTAYVYIRGITTWQQLERKLVELAAEVHPRYKKKKLLSCIIDGEWIEGLPDSQDEAIAFLATKAKRYLPSVEFSDVGATITIEADSYRQKEDIDFFDDITGFLFTCSGKPYLITTEKCAHPAIDVRTEEILFWKSGELVRETISEIID